VLAISVVLGGAGCSLSDFSYLSDDYGAAGSGGGAGDAPVAGSGGSAGADAQAGGGSGGQGAGGQGGSEPTAGSGGRGGASGLEDQFFCKAEHAVFDKGPSGVPPIDLPPSGNYVVHKHGTVSDCLATPNWPELGDKQYWAITHECGDVADEPGEVWHLEHVCSDVYRFTSYHDSAEERQLALTDFNTVGTPLYSVASERSIDPTMLFHLRFEELLEDVVRWRLSPAINGANCVEQVNMERYGEVDVTRVVHYPCTGNLGNQSWNLLPVP
jgi:hypothetical protein